jgi:hypothetical protein
MSVRLSRPRRRRFRQSSRFGLRSGIIIALLSVIAVKVDRSAERLRLVYIEAVTANCYELAWHGITCRALRGGQGNADYRRGRDHRIINTIEEPGL